MPKGSTGKKVRDCQAALVCGGAFQRLAEELIPRIGVIDPGPSGSMSDELAGVVACATNLAFAIELYLKALLTQLDLGVPPTHDLRHLYEEIPRSVREVIESVYNMALPDEVRRLGGRVSVTVAKGPLEEPQWNDYKVSMALADVLSRSRDLFQSWRYVFEFSEPEHSPYQYHKFEYGALRCAAEVLRVEVTARLQGTEEPGEGAVTAKR
jgi:hypothetical protein